MCQRLSPTVYLFEVLYIGIILLWPWRGARFLYPIQPFLYYHFLLGILFIINQVERFTPFLRKYGRFVSYICTGMVIAGILTLSIYRGVTDSMSSLAYTRDLRIGASWLRENSSQDALIMAQQPQSIYLYAQRQTVDYPAINDARELKRYILAQGIDYILVAPKLEWRADGSLQYDNYTRDIVLPFLNLLTETCHLRLVYESTEDMVKVYQVLR